MVDWNDFFSFLAIIIGVFLIIGAAGGFIYLMILSDQARMEEKAESCQRLCSAKGEDYVNVKSTTAGYLCGCVDDGGGLVRYEI